jgi:hypothetical protein
MKTFDETYADSDFKQHLDQAQSGWMAQVPRNRQPDLHVEGLRGSLLARVLSVFSGQRVKN